MTKHKGTTFILIITLVLAMILFYGFSIEPKSLALSVSSPQITDLPSDWNNVKIAYFSDLTLTEKSGIDSLKKVTREIEEQRPDIIIYAGDLFDNKNTSDLLDSQITELLSQLRAPLGKFALTAYQAENVDNINRSQTILRNARFSIVDNTSRKLYNHSLQPLQLIAINEAASENDIDNLLATSENTTSLLLTTQPNNYEKVQNYPSIHLTLASGTYGGLINFPGLNKLFVKNMESNYNKGYYNRNSTAPLLVSSGVGTPSYFPFRLFNRPSIYVFALQSKVIPEKRPEVQTTSEQPNPIDDPAHAEQENGEPAPTEEPVGVDENNDEPITDNEDAPQDEE